MPVLNSSGMYYPLTKMNFVVSVDGISGSAAFSEVTGVDASVDVIEFRQGNAGSLAPVKIPGLVKHGNIPLRMGYTRSQDFKTWIQACVSERRNENIRHNVVIELIDIVTTDQSPQSVTEGVDSTLTWILKDAWVCKYNGPDLNASASEVAIESVEIAYEELVIPN